MKNLWTVESPPVFASSIKAEDALRMSQERWREYFELSLVGMAVTGADKRYLQVNDKLCQVLGYTREELLSQNWGSLTHPDDLQRQLPMHEQLIKGQIRRYGVEKRVARKDGRMVWLSVDSVSHVNEAGEVEYCLSHIQDITERKQAEEALQESAAQYRALTEAAFDHLLLVEGQTLLKATDKFASMLDCALADIIGQPFINLLAPTSRSLYREQRSNAESGAPFEVSLLHRDGSMIPVEICLRRVPHGGRDVVVAAIGDLREKRRIEEMLRTKSRLEATSILAAGIAHEINNPLASIKNSFELIKGAISPDYPYYEYVPLIEQEIDRIRVIIQQMYNLYHPEAQRAHSLDLESLLHTMLKLLSHSFRERKLTTRMTTHGKPIHVVLSVSEVQQIFYNILTNAIEASPIGKEILVALHYRKNSVRVEVTDQGSGIAPDVMPHIFEPFFSTKGYTGKGGMGLGLSITHSLIAAMGGKIEVESKPGKGTTFIVTLQASVPATTVLS